MKKLLLLCGIALLCNSLSSAQELPQLTPPSPTAYQLTKYGDVPVNESSGNANFNIPLLNISSGDLAVPISLSYTTSGVKVNQIASWVGMGWDLNAGGVITRSIKGLADDLNQRAFTTAANVANLKATNLVPGFLNFGIDVLEGSDYQPDIYTFNIGGFSGTFYIDQNSVPKFLKKENEIKIEKTTNGFTLTTPNGVIYHFDGTGEFSRSESLSSGSAGHQNPSQLYQTTWLLTKISNFKGDEIHFKYDYSTSYLYTTGFDQTIKASSVINSGNPGAVLSTTSYKSYVQSKKISEIYTNRNNSKIIFNATKSRNDLPSEYKLNSIELKNGNSLIKKFNLNYNFITSTKSYYGADNMGWLDLAEHFKRMFLTSVKETDKNGVETNGKTHSFEYDDPSGLPPRMSFAQDLLGYYNGKQNYGYTPISAGSTLGGYSLSSISRGDRSADYIYAKKGMLTKITYPTKGYTILEYEPTVVSQTIHTPIMSNFSMNVNNSNMQTEFTQDFNSQYDQTISIFPNLTILQGNDYVHDVAVITVKNKETNTYILNQTINHSFNGSLNATLEANVIYEFKISLANVRFDEVQTTLNFSYQSGVTSANSSVNKSGVRIKKVKKRSSSSSPEEIMRYYYTSKENLNSSTYSQIFTFQFVENQEGQNEDTYVLSSSSINHFYITLPQSFMYNKVTVSIGDNFEGGGIEKEFHINSIPTNQVVWENPILNSSATTNMAGLHNGRLLKETKFEKLDGGTIKVVTEKQYFYKDVDTYIDAFSARRRYLKTNVNMGSIQYLDGVDIESYKLYSRWSAIDSISTKQYFGNDVVLTTQKYSYDSNLAGLPTEITTTNSKGETLKTQYTYPSIGSTQRIQNRFEVVETKNYKGTTLLSHQKTDYKNWGNNLVLPEFVKTAKGGASLEDRIVFHNYDNKGNPIAVSKKDGTQIVYIWGYHQTKPIAKIENASEAEVTAAIGTLNGNYNTLAEIQTLSNNDTNGSSENTLRTALNDLRNALPKAQVTSFTYDPLIGVTSVTDPRGRCMFYYYDSFNRLWYVKDNEGNIVSENQYNYKN